MNIIKSFINKNDEYKFIKETADCSKKTFYRISYEDKIIDQILVQITKVNDDFDEYFDNEYTNLSQYDYFKSIFQLLQNTIGNTPKIIDYNDNFGLVLMEYIGNTQLKELADKDLMYMKSIDWLIKLNKLNTDIKMRNFGPLSLKKEVDNFMNWVCNFMTQTDKYAFMNELITQIKIINKFKKGLCHRDFQARNIMCYNDDIYIIDVQDMCYGPYLYDLACLLYDSNNIIDSNQILNYAKHYYDNTDNNIEFDEFYKQVKLLGLFRIFKSYSTHMKYFVRNNRLKSLDLIMNNKKLLEQFVEEFPFLNILNKYNFNVVILAAGKGSRMNTNIPKTLCEINNKPMLFHILDKVIKLNPHKIVIVVGHKKEMIIEKLKEYPYKNIEFVEQTEQLGTGHAVKVTKDILSDNNTDALILFGDKPHMPYVLLKDLVITHYKQNNDCTLVTYKDSMSHTKCGRVIRNNNKIIEIYEDNNENYNSDEFSGGIHMFKCEPMFSALELITNDNKQKEYYLCDIIKIIAQNGENINNVITTDKFGLLNVNTQTNLAQAFPDIRIPQ